MTDPEAISRFAKAWLEYWDAPAGSETRRELEWVSEKEWEYISTAPQATLLLILEILKHKPIGKTLAVLAAGPMEDVLSEHGSAIIDQVETEARQNPAFAKLLGGVWQGGMSADIWERLQKVWNRRGWDGIPD